MPRDAETDKPRTVTRLDLVDALHRETGLHREECAEHLENVLATIIDRLDRDEQVKIKNFGTFNVREKGARVARNPKTLEEVTIPPRRVVQFRMSKETRTRIVNALK